jgi:Flp pilus assembly protein TadG
MRLRKPRCVIDCEHGVAAVETAFMLPPFIIMLYGVVKVSMLLWTMGSLHYAAEAAARYASINCSSSCTPSPATYALDNYYGQTLDGTNPFSYSATGCGNTVTASYTYSLDIPLVGNYSVPLTTTACFP